MSAANSVTACDRCFCTWSGYRDVCPRCGARTLPMPRPDRPPPTSYHDEQGVFHPGPGCNGYRGHLLDCLSCYATLKRARGLGETWTVAYLSTLRRPAPPPPTSLPGPGEAALVAAPRSLPARWRRYVQPGPLVCLMAGVAGAWLLPVSVTAAAIGVLIVFAVAIHRYAPDAVPAARAVRR